MEKEMENKIREKLRKAHKELDEIEQMLSPIKPIHQEPFDPIEERN